MALDIRSLYIVEPTDLVMHPEELERISITHDGVSVAYMHDGAGWYTFGEYTSLMGYYPRKRRDLTPETVITEIIRAIALSKEESVELWLS